MSENMSETQKISFNAALHIWWAILWRFAACVLVLLTVLFLIAYAIYGAETIHYEFHGFAAVAVVIFVFLVLVMLPGTVAVQWFLRRNAKTYRIIETELK